MMMMMTLQNCEKCKVYEKKDPKAPLHTITTTELMDLVHIDLVGMEVTIKTKEEATGGDQPFLTIHSGL